MGHIPTFNFQLILCLGPISWRACPRQAFPTYLNVTVYFIGPVCSYRENEVFLKWPQNARNTLSPKLYCCSVQILLRFRVRTEYMFHPVLTWLSLEIRG
jgi:hypothetical protein